MHEHVFLHSRISRIATWHWQWQRESPHVLSTPNSLTHGGGITVVAGTNVGDHDGLGVPPQTVLQQTRQFTVAVRNVVPAFAVHQGRNDVAQGRQR